ncbi:unnamed protein product [Rhizophagus irregularis]|nr:unnamed protein product [Rhizophagus irregularis]
MQEVRKKRVSSLGTVISVISKNVKTRKERILLIKLIRVESSFGFSFWYLIGIGFTLDRCRLWLLHDVSFDFWMLDRYRIIRCWIDVDFDSLTLDIGFDFRISVLDSWMLDRYRL